MKTWNQRSYESNRKKNITQSLTQMELGRERMYELSLCARLLKNKTLSYVDYTKI